jgi:hypothetical protein
MKKILTMAVAVLLVSGAAFAGGDKNCEKSCSKKEAKNCQKEGKSCQKEKKADKADKAAVTPKS